MIAPPLASDRKPKLYSQIVRDLAQYRYPVELKQDIVTRLYWKEKSIFDPKWVQWFKEFRELRAQCEVVRRQTCELRHIRHFRLSELESEHNRLLAAVLQKEGEQPEFRSNPVTRL